MISISIVNTLGILALIFLIPIKYIHYAIIMLALLGQFAGSWEIFASYKYNSKEEKERKILIITVIFRNCYNYSFNNREKINFKIFI